MQTNLRTTLINLNNLEKILSEYSDDDIWINKDRIRSEWQAKYDEQVKDYIDPSTIQETRRGLGPFGLNMIALYSARTQSGEKREIFRQGYPDLRGGKDSQANMLINLIKEVKMNPGFADTLTAETRPHIKTELDYSGSPLKYLKYLFTGK